ncbi:MAG: hypothetical protein NVS1B4_12000 [Gemmatimonadaceae bacterium]
MTGPVFILGAGRAGRGLARALRASGLEGVMVHGRRPSDEDDVTAGPIPVRVAEATMVVVAVRDNQMEAALAEIEHAPLAPGCVVLHMSGCGDPSGLTSLRSRGHPCGTFHPLVPIAVGAKAVASFRGAYVGVDGDPRAIASATSLAQRLDARTLTIPAGQKATYHAAAVIASNFPVVLAAIAEALLVATGIALPVAREVVRSLIDGAVANLQGRSAAEALTGPAVRGDKATIAAHLDTLQAEPNIRELYRLLTNAAQTLAPANVHPLMPFDR